LKALLTPSLEESLVNPQKRSQVLAYELKEIIDSAAATVSRSWMSKYEKFGPQIDKTKPNTYAILDCFADMSQRAASCGNPTSL
jgi:hypothetical protein